MISTTQVSVSPVILGEVLALLPPEIPADRRNAEAEYWVQEIILNAKRFVEKFLTVPEFFNREPYHEFTGIALTENDTGKVLFRYNYLLQYAFPELGIFSLREVRMHEDYQVRKVIAESHFPEYKGDLWPSMYDRN